MNFFVTPTDEKKYQQLESCGIFNGIQDNCIRFLQMQDKTRFVFLHLAGRSKNISQSQFLSAAVNILYQNKNLGIIITM